MSNEELIKQELEKVVDEAKALYNASGKRTSGKWEKGLEIKSSTNKGELYSYGYLAGRSETRKRKKGSKILQENILQWLKDKNIKPLEDNMKLSSLAFLIARKIHREGTDKSRHLKVFEEILTPQRIQQIIDKVSEFNVSLFVDEISIEFKKLTTEI